MPMRGRNACPLVSGLAGRVPSSFSGGLCQKPFGRVSDIFDAPFVRSPSSALCQPDDGGGDQAEGLACKTERPKGEL
jgi:hypothetical protein